MQIIIIIIYSYKSDMDGTPLDKEAINYYFIHVHASASTLPILGL